MSEQAPTTHSSPPHQQIMIFLLLVYFITQSDLGGDASPIPLMERRAEVSCDDLDNCRTMWDIVWSCLSTVLLCTWVSLHPNITIAPDTRDVGSFEAKLWRPLRGFVELWHSLLDFLKNKLPLFLWALIAPEYILAWAIRQYLRAGEIQQECNARQTIPYAQPPYPRKWTRAHGFFIIMGGFHLYSLPDGAPSVPYPQELSIPSKFVLPLPGHSDEHSCEGHSRERETAEHPLDFKHLSAHELAYLAPTKREIKDRGKADIIAKILVVLQTSWFVAQCIARGVEQLPLTELEVVTLAYATMNAFIYYFWWDKPKDVGCPVRVYKVSKADRVESGEKDEWYTGGWSIFNIIAYVIGLQDQYFRLSEESQVPMFWSGKSGERNDTRSMIGASIIGMAFGAIHFIAWNSEFPSHIELLLWRISSVAMTAVPLTVTIVCGISVALSWRDRLYIIAAFLVLTFPLTGLLYVFARIATLAIAFTTLRALPSDAFKTVDWATFIPHL